MKDVMDNWKEDKTNYFRLSYILIKIEEGYNSIFDMVCYKYFSGEKEKLVNYLININ